jgi:hypothetical protein
MVGFLKRLFGGGEPGRPSYDVTEYKGYRITPAPEPQGSQWLTAGRIEKELDGETRRHDFIRADLHTSAEDAASFAVTKAQQIIDQEGDRLFQRERG